MASQIAVIGNGPSRYLYTPFRGDVCVCNIPQLDIEYDYISIIDEKAANYVNTHNLKFKKPILVSTNINKKITTTEARTVFTEKLMNNAATASYYFAEHYDVVWLYGCDALWSEITTSHQDTLIPRPSRMSNLHIKWREYWARVWKQPAKFVIVCPKGTKTVDYGENVIWNPSKV